MMTQAASILPLGWGFIPVEQKKPRAKVSRMPDMIAHIEQNGACTTKQLLDGVNIPVSYSVLVAKRRPDLFKLESTKLNGRYTRVISLVEPD